MIKQTYRPTESKYKDGAQEMYVTYDLDQKTRSGRTATYPKVKRVYIAGDVTDWRAGHFTKRTGRKVKGLRVVYKQEREGFYREATKQGSATYVQLATTTLTQIVELPEKAKHIKFSPDQLPAEYGETMQSVR